MRVSERLDRAQRRHAVLGFPIACAWKFFDDFGAYLAALLTYYALISIFPLLLLSSTILSIVLVGHPDLQAQLLDSALARFPIIGDQLKAPEAFRGNDLVVIIGILGATYGALGLAQALQYAGNTIWHVPRNSRPDPFRSRGRSLLLVATAGLGMAVVVIGSAVLHTAVESSALVRVLLLAGTVLVTALVLLVAFQLAPYKRLRTAQLMPGVLLAALAMQGLQSLSYLYVGRVIQGATATNAVFATVLGLLAYLYAFAVVVVFCMEVNAVYSERLWPRALLTPFTDNVVPTPADKASYSRQARAQRVKGFEQIVVSFGPSPKETEEAERPHREERRRENQRDDAADPPGSTPPEADSRPKGLRR